MTHIQFNNEATHGTGECPGCGATIHVVGSPAEKRLRWCCLKCLTVGSAPLEERGAYGGAEDEDESPVMLH